MIGFLRRNLAYKMVSVAIAILLYSIASNSANNRRTDIVTVTPQASGIPDDLVVRGPIGSFTVTATGPSAAVRGFRDESVKATLDLSHVKAGTNKVPVDYKLPSGDIDTSTWPATRDVQVERKWTQEYDVDAQFDNEPPPGYAYGDPETTPLRVKVSGLQADVQRVGRVIAVVPKAPGAFNIDQPVDVVAQDDRQQPIDSVAIDPPKVRVRIPLRRAVVNKTLVLSAELVGMPAPGFAVAGYVFRPASLTVSGTPDNLSMLSTLSIPIRVDGAKAGFVQTVHVSLPPGVSPPTPGDVTAEAEVHVAALSAISPVAAPPSGTAALPTSPTSAAPIPPSRSAP